MCIRGKEKEALKNAIQNLNFKISQFKTILGPIRSFNEELNLFTDKKNLLPHINSTYHYFEIF